MLLAAARQMSERLTLLTSAWVLVFCGSTPQRMSSVRNHRSCDLNGKLALSAQNFMRCGEFFSVRPSP